MPCKVKGVPQGRLSGREETKKQRDDPYDSVMIPFLLGSASPCKREKGGTTGPTNHPHSSNSSSSNLANTNTSRIREGEEKRGSGEREGVSQGRKRYTQSYRQPSIPGICGGQ